eukprot:4584461-Prymnesium_polylepis.1
MVRDWSASARDNDCRIHHVAYVDSRKPRDASNCVARAGASGHSQQFWRFGFTHVWRVAPCGVRGGRPPVSRLGYGFGAQMIGARVQQGSPSRSGSGSVWVRVHCPAHVRRRAARTFSAARIRPTEPSWMRSRSERPRLMYFFAIDTTSRRLALTSSARARRMRPSSAAYASAPPATPMCAAASASVTGRPSSSSSSVRALSHRSSSCTATDSAFTSSTDSSRCLLMLRRYHLIVSSSDVTPPRRGLEAATDRRGLEAATDGVAAVLFVAAFDAAGGLRVGDRARALGRCFTTVSEFSSFDEPTRPWITDAVGAPHSSARCAAPIASLALCAPGCPGAARGIEASRCCRRRARSAATRWASTLTAACCSSVARHSGATCRWGEDPPQRGGKRPRCTASDRRSEAISIVRSKCATR